MPLMTEDVQVIHSFTDRERSEFSLEQANLLDEREGIDKNLAHAKKQYAAELASADAKIKSLSYKIRQGTEARSIRCILIDNRPEAGYRLVVRTDNGHVTRRRKLEAHERQMQLISGQQVPYAAMALLEVDDKGWDKQFVGVWLWEEEYLELKMVEPSIHFQAMAAMIEEHKQEVEPPTTRAETIITAEIVEEGLCHWCEDKVPFDPNLPNSHVLPDGKKRTCKKSSRAKG